MEQLNGTPSYKATTTASVPFANVLSSVVSRNMDTAVQAQGQAMACEFRTRKELVEDGNAMSQDDEEQESIYKTVKKIETKIIRLAQLERRMAGI